ncbi:cbl-interacting serine/threonine-protein kinase 5 [Phtheirospermum japonicum]|uniref:non-specific serine/threonine protein kinase n=1 Tax=Phtheirospermum japonicum TaxID=374723 RepID=A0A830B1I4_9LAMI|nr:cbl-interacting serine/threonine-protein kinase 5 [Phtheirospermum japonicum]
MGESKKILLGKYEIGRVLGKGNFAKVYHGRNLGTSECVAIKVIKKDESIKHQKMMEQIKREIAIMRRVRHPHIVELKEVMATRSRIFLVMEYVGGGALFSKVARGGRLKEGAARRYFQQLVSAVDFCHSRGVYHRDLKPENLLLDENGDLKISDFGLSALYENRSSDGLLHTQCGTPAYIAPEVLRTKGYDGARADIWSCGVVLYVLLAGYLPFQGDNLIAMCKKIFRAQYEFPSWFSNEPKRLISKLLVSNPGKRISIPGIMRVGWFREGFKRPHAFSTHESIFEKFDEDDKFISSGFDLSSMFEDQRTVGSTFTSRCSARETLGRMETVGKRLGFKVARMKDFKLRLLGAAEGRKGRLSVAAEVFKVAPEVTVVELSKSSGDTLEFIQFREEDIRPALRDIVWTWQGESNFECCDPIKSDV